MKRFLFVVILLALLLASCQPPEVVTNYNVTQEPERVNESMGYYVKRVVDFEYGYICYYLISDGGIWCDKLEK